MNGATRLGLRARLVMATMLAALLAVTVLVVGLQALLAGRAEQDSVDALRGRADAAAATVRVRDGRVRVLETASAVLDNDLWIFDGSGARIDGSVPPPRLRDAVDDLTRAGRVRTLDVGSDYRLLARPVTPPGGDRPAAVVVAAADLAPYESSERRSLWLSLALGAVSVAGAGAAAWVAAGYALGRVRRMAHRADTWREHDLAGRFGLGEPYDELTDLGRTLDRMLDRITAALHAERRLTDEVAHELRTPLTVIRSEAQLAQLEGGPSASLSAIVAATERMQASIETMLAVARSHQGTEQRCVVAAVLEAQVEHRPVRADVRVRLADVDPTLVVAAPSGVVTAALSPLLDNAVRHARAVVRLRATADGDRVVVHVEDDGPGVASEDAEAVFAPGHSTSGGAGLGLPLARRLAHSVGGELVVLDDGAERHGHVVLSLPRE